MNDIDIGYSTGCSKLQIERIITDTSASFVVDTPIDLTDRLQGIKASFNNIEEKVNADNGVKDVLTGTPDAKITINLTQLTPYERATIMGNTSVGAIRGGGDTSSIPNYLVKYQEDCSGGTKYVEYLKVKFALTEKSAETKKSDSLTPQYVTLEGTAMIRNYKPAVDPTQNNIFYEISTKDPSYAGEGATWFSAGDNLSTPDLVAPALSSSLPDADAIGVAAAANYVWTFDKAILPSSVTSANFFVVKDSDGSAVAGALSHSTDMKEITFNPTSNLSSSTAYRAIATVGVKSLTSIALANPLVRKFTTT